MSNLLWPLPVTKNHPLFFTWKTLSEFWPETLPPLFLSKNKFREAKHCEPPGWRLQVHGTALDPPPLKNKRPFEFTWNNSEWHKMDFKHNFEKRDIISCEAQLNTCTCDLSVWPSVRLSVCPSVRLKTEFSPCLVPIWQLITVYHSIDRIWQLLTAYDSLWQFLTFDSFWQLMAAYDSFCQLFASYDSLWRLMTAYDLATIHCSNLSEASCHQLSKASCNQLSIIESNHVIGCYWPTEVSCYRQTVIRCHGETVMEKVSSAVMSKLSCTVVYSGLIFNELANYWLMRQLATSWWVS